MMALPRNVGARALELVVVGRAVPGCSTYLRVAREFADDVDCDAAVGQFGAERVPERVR